MAVNDFIRIDQTVTTSTNAGDLVNMIKTLRKIIEQVEQVKGIMDHQTNGTVFTTLETMFGLPAGGGTIVYNLVVGCRAAVRSPSTLEMIDRVG